MMDRRRFCTALALAGLGASAAAAPRTVIDMTGRAVRLASTPKRIVLLEARDILTMNLLIANPAARVAGWAAVDRIDSEVLQQRFEAERRIPVVGKQTPATISIEGIIQLAPDLVVASAFMAPSAGNFIERLESLGIPVLFSDASSNAAPPDRAGPVASLHRNLRMWGEVLGAEERAAACTAFADQHLADLAQRLAGARPVTTYLEVQSTLDDCCWAAGKQVWGELLTLAGGQPLPGVTAPWFQKLQREYLMATPHDVYIASGGGWVSGGRPAIGPGIDAAQGRAGLQRLVERPGFAKLPSTRQHRVHGIWTGLITVPPLNLLFVEVAAKWLHPDRCADLDPAHTLAQINERFAATTIEGPLWVSIQE